jgi:hypothetical protein
LPWSALSRLHAKELALALQQNGSISVLNISHNELETGGIAHIAAAMGRNSALTILDVSHNMADSHRTDKHTRGPGQPDFATAPEGASALSTAAIRDSCVLQGLTFSDDQKQSAARLDFKWTRGSVLRGAGGMWTRF